MVTGGAGFIGSNFVRAALKQTSSVVLALDKLTYSGSLKNLEKESKNERFFFFNGDISDRRIVQDIFKDYEPFALVNFAAETHVDRSIDGPSDFIQTNIVGTFDLLEVSRAYYKELTEKERQQFRFLHVSTDEVYGSLGDEGRFVEDSPYQPNSPYSASKAAADHLVRAYFETYGLPTLITNTSNNFGPNQFPEKLIPLMILNAMEGRKLPIYGNGKNVRDWIYVEDHCAGILKVLKEGTLGEKYNIGAQQEKTNIEVVDKICSVLDELFPADKNPKLKAQGIKKYSELKSFVKDRPGHDQRYAIDPEKMEREFGWKAEHDFETGVIKTVRWYLDNQDWCSSVQEGQYNRERLGVSS